jgi:hypothetical protein
MTTAPLESSSACGCCTSRRRFLKAGCGLCTASLVPGPLGSLALAADKAKTGGAGTGRSRVRLVFACFGIKQERPTWPHIGHDFAPDIEQVTSALGQLCPQVEFLPSVARGPEDAQKLVTAGAAEHIDSYLVYQMNNWVQVMQCIVAAGKPTLVADFTFAGSGGFLLYTAALRRVHKNFSVVASSKIEDLAASARCFELLKQGKTTTEFVAACDRTRQARTAKAGSASCKADSLQLAGVAQCLTAMKRAKLVCVGGEKQKLDQQIERLLGIRVVQSEFKELAAAYDATDLDTARQLAAQWKSAAQSVTLHDAEATLEKSARMCLAQKAMLAKHQAEAITINCLGGFYGGNLAAYPCLGYVELLNAGLVGACEADLLSTVTMIAMKHLAGRPGYISDPVVESANHLCPLRSLDEDVRSGGRVESLRDHQSFRGPSRRGGPLHPAAGIHDHYAQAPSEPRRGHLPPCQGGREYNQRPCLPHKIGRRGRGRH